MKTGRLVRTAFWVIVVSMVGSGALLAPRKAACDATGCSLVNYGTPTWAAGCFAGGDISCYNCEYSYGGGYTRCWESGSGDARVCYDYQY